MERHFCKNIAILTTEEKEFDEVWLEDNALAYSQDNQAGPLWVVDVEDLPFLKDDKLKILWRSDD